MGIDSNLKVKACCLHLYSLARCVIEYSYFVDKVSSLENNSTQFLISAPNQRSLLKRQEEWVKVGGLINITRAFQK
jgi:hypothetical protein